MMMMMMMMKRNRKETSAITGRGRMLKKMKNMRSERHSSFFRGKQSALDRLRLKGQVHLRMYITWSVSSCENTGRPIAVGSCEVAKSTSHRKQSCAYSLT